MKLISRKQVDIKKWNALIVSDPNASLYCQAVFLDALSANWMLLVNDDYSLGIPIPYVKHLGVKGIYTPNFIRTLDFVGNTDLLTPEFIDRIVELLKKNFSYCQLKMEIPLINDSAKYFNYQVLDSPILLNTQAKRKIKKFHQSGLKIQNSDILSVHGIIANQLFEKVEGLNLNDFQRFEKLLDVLSAKKLYILSVSDEHDVLGGMVFYIWKKRVHYIKGGSLKEAKNAGAMYAMMEQAIIYTQEKGYLLDFGGSNVEGVAQFNNSFGARDQSYSSFEWNNAPFWFVILRKLKKMF